MGLNSNAIRGASIFSEMHYPIGGLHCIRRTPFLFYSWDFILFGGVRFVWGISFHSGDSMLFLHSWDLIPFGGDFIPFGGFYCFRGTSCRSRNSILFWGLLAIWGPPFYSGDFIPLGGFHSIWETLYYSGVSIVFGGQR